MIKKGPYSVSEQKEKIDKLKGQIQKYTNKQLFYNRILNNLMILYFVCVSISLLSTAKIKLYILIPGAIIIILYFLIFIFPYTLKIQKLNKELSDLRFIYMVNSTTVHLTEIVDYIEVNDLKVVIPPLNTINDCYYYEHDYFDFDEYDKRNIFTFDFDLVLEEYYLKTKGFGRMHLLNSEYKLLKSKSKPI